MGSLLIFVFLSNEKYANLKIWHFLWVAQGLRIPCTSYADWSDFLREVAGRKILTKSTFSRAGNHIALLRNNIRIGKLMVN